MERGLMMLVHSALIGLFVYGIMIYAGQRQAVAENRSLIMFAAVLVYMIVFGHGMPTKLNKNL
jgi:hypothetical protein